ncbi:MAG: DUF58 domain-containing protein [Flavobacteriaceae bacterium]
MIKLLKSIYLSQRFFISIALICVLFLFSNWIQGLYAVVWILVLALIILLLIDASMLYQKSGLTGNRVLPEKFSNSDLNYVLVKLDNQYDFKIKIVLIDELPIQFQKRDFKKETTLFGKEQNTLTYEVRPVERGEYVFGNLNCYVSSPLGFIKRRYSFSQKQMVKVYPSFIQMKRYDFLALDNKLSHFGFKKIRRIGNTQEFEQIKDYVAGDDIRTINWNATAKRANLMVNQYQDEKMQPVYSIIDTSRVMKMPFGGLKLLDYAINSTLAFSNIALKKGDKVGFVDFSNKANSFLPAQSKKTYLNTILETLYNIDTHFLDADYGVLQGLVKRKITHRSLIMLYTNFEHISSLYRQLPYLQSIAKKHVLVVIFFENTELTKLISTKAETLTDIYDQTIAREFQNDKKTILKALQQKGIQAILTPPKDLTVNTINKYLEIKARGIL